MVAHAPVVRSLRIGLLPPSWPKFRMSAYLPFRVFAINALSVRNTIANILARPLGKLNPVTRNSSHFASGHARPKFALNVFTSSVHERKALATNSASRFIQKIAK
jgi:hypothetical protein